MSDQHLEIKAPIVATAAAPRSLYQRQQTLQQGRLAQFCIALLIAAGLSLLLWQLLPLIYRFWNFSLAQLILALPLDGAELITQPPFTPRWNALETTAISQPLAAPSLGQVSAHLASSVLIYLAAGRLRAPFRAPTRLLSIFHSLNVLASLTLPGGSVYSVEAHTHSLSLFTQGLLLLLPLVMAATHSIIERSNARRILASALIAVWLIASLPLKLLAHALLIQTLGGVAMPTLFLVFGPACDILAVTALYAWAVTWRHGQN